MKLPDYTITNGTLNNVSQIEYNKSYIENATILKNWEDRLKKEAFFNNIKFSLYKEGFNINDTVLKKTIQNISTKTDSRVKNFVEAYKYTETSSLQTTLEVENIVNYIELIEGNKSFRSTKLPNTSNPEEILADINNLVDWYNSLDAIDTHPLIRIAILRANLELIKPLNKYSFVISDIMTIHTLKTLNYNVKDYISIEENIYKNFRTYNLLIRDLFESRDFTNFIEFFCEIFLKTISSVSEQVKILEKDTKVLKAAPDLQLSPREEKIITYLQDYGFIRNKDFSLIFPNVSEDTVLRVLKKLSDKGIVIKRGKTKSSRYELS